MKRDSKAPLPTVVRRRPTDATGLFWGAVFSLYGLFLGAIFSVVWIPIFFFYIALQCVFWQFKKWKRDRVLNDGATRWCQFHYPDCGGTLIVDFMVGLAQVTDLQFADLPPSIPLVDLALGAEGPIYQAQSAPADLVRWACREAKIRWPKPSTFNGSTLDDAVRFVASFPA
ncbi:hypothetical protein [Schlesneria sp. DSM 10557]|uniref:hypothetical protein n=1 Tax=Schlesneria sp. DSM 10557 TaxID=3044399 RepID=UPI00359F3B0D